MNSLILQQQEEVIALAQFDINDAVLKKCLLKEDETVITVPDGVTTIGKDALCGLQSVIAVMLPESLKVINDGAFYGFIIAAHSFHGTRNCDSSSSRFDKLICLFILLL